MKLPPLSFNGERIGIDLSGVEGGLFQRVQVEEELSWFVHNQPIFKIMTHFLSGVVHDFIYNSYKDVIENHLGVFFTCRTSIELVYESYGIILLKLEID